MSLKEQLRQGQNFLIYDVSEDWPVVILTDETNVGDAPLREALDDPQIDNSTAIWEQMLKIKPDLHVLSIPNVDRIKLVGPSFYRWEAVRETLEHHGYRRVAKTLQQEAEPVEENGPEEEKPSSADGQKEAEIEQPDYSGIIVFAIVMVSVVAGLIVIAIA